MPSTANAFIELFAEASTCLPLSPFCFFPGFCRTLLTRGL
jgi:hypothetical protein